MITLQNYIHLSLFKGQTSANIPSSTLITRLMSCKYRIYLEFIWFHDLHLWLYRGRVIDELRREPETGCLPRPHCCSRCSRLWYIRLLRSAAETSSRRRQQTEPVTVAYYTCTPANSTACRLQDNSQINSTLYTVQTSHTTHKSKLNLYGTALYCYQRTTFASWKSVE